MDAYERIIASKHEPLRTTLQNLSTDIATSCSAYDSANLTGLTPLVVTNKQRAALLHCYNSETESLAAVRQAILDIAGSTCPYCGIDRPTTLDHYAPKDIFPEFSVFPLNLIPSCFDCNHKKGRQWAPHEPRFFLHAYLDHWPDGIICLQADISWTTRGPLFEFSLVPPDNNLPLFEILRHHVENLRLLDAYGKSSGEEFTSGIDMWTELNITSNILKRQIERVVHKRRMREGMLSWRAALWEAVFRNDEAIDYLIQQQ